MPYPFRITRTSAANLSESLKSDSHPSLPLQATLGRNVLRQALKDYHNAQADSRAGALLSIVSALKRYLPLVFTLLKGLSPDRVVGDEEVDVILIQEVSATWRSMLVDPKGLNSLSRPIKSVGLDAEVAMSTSLLAVTSYLQAKTQLRSQQDIHRSGGSVSNEVRMQTISTAMKLLLDVHSIYRFLADFALNNMPNEAPIEASHPVLSALADMALSEATLLAILKDDPFPGVVTANRNVNDKQWMISAPKIPKVRMHLFARICMAGYDHADRGYGLVRTVKSTRNLGKSAADQAMQELQEYLESLRKVAKAKACRFAALDAEAAGTIGKAIGWLRTAMFQLDIPLEKSRAHGSSVKAKLTAKITRARKERVEDKRVQKDRDWASDAGSLEEARIIEMLLDQWEHVNDTVHFETVPDVQEMLAYLPSGREYHTPREWNPPMPDAQSLASMRAPPDPEEELHATLQAREEADDSDQEASSEHHEIRKSAAYV